MRPPVNDAPPETRVDDVMESTAVAVPSARVASGVNCPLASM
jgi:hypothetical protein